MSASDTSFTLSYAALQQQGIAAIKETQDYAVRVAELAADNPFVLAAQGVPTASELIDSTFAIVQQTLELQRELVGKLAATATK